MHRVSTPARAFFAVVSLCATLVCRPAFAAPGGTGQGSGGKPASAGPEAPGAGAQGEAAGQGRPAESGGSSGRERSDSRGSGALDAAERRARSVGEKSADEFRRWLSASKEGRSLVGVKESLVIIASPAFAAGVPVEAFAARTREAVAKGVSFEVMVRALKADAARWIWFAGLVRDSPWPPSRSAPGLYLAVSAALRNGLGEEPVREVAIWAMGARADAEKVGAALNAAAAMTVALGPLDVGGKSVALSLAKSGLSVGSYGEAVALARRAAASGIGPERFAQALESTLGSGGSLAELERGLFP